MNASRSARGFTLVELVVALVIAGIVTGFIAALLATPVEAYFAQTRRAVLADAAEASARWIARDARPALPGSLREGASGPLRWIDMIVVTSTTIYRDAGGEGDILRFDIPDAQFDVLGARGTGFSHAVVNSSMAPAAPDAAADRVLLTPAHQFPAPSTRRRVFLVSGMTRYECDTASRTLRRYVGLPVTTPNAPVVAASTLVANDIAACRFAVTAGAAQRADLLRLELTVARNTAGNTEQLRVVRQIELANLP